MKYVETTGELIKILSLLPADCLLVGEQGYTGFMVGALDNYHNVHTTEGEESLGVVIEAPEADYTPMRYRREEGEGLVKKGSKGNVVSIFK